VASDAQNRTRKRARLPAGPPPHGHAVKVLRVCRSVATHRQLMSEDDDYSMPDPPDDPPPSPTVAALRRPRTTMETREMAVAPSSEPHQHRPQHRRSTCASCCTTGRGRRWTVWYRELRACTAGLATSPDSPLGAWRQWRRVGSSYLLTFIRCSRPSWTRSQLCRWLFGSVTIWMPRRIGRSKRQGTRRVGSRDALGH